MFLKTIKGVKVSPLLLKNFAKLSTNSCCKYKLTYSIFTSDKSFFLNKNLANRFTILKSFWITNFKSDEINITAWVLLNWSQSSTSKNLVIKSKHIFLMDKSSSSKQSVAKSGARVSFQRKSTIHWKNFAQKHCRTSRCIVSSQLLISRCRWQLWLGTSM